MPRRQATARAVVAKHGPDFDENGEFRLSSVFPDPPAGHERGPFPKQRWVYEQIFSGAAQGGGIVYQGGKGCAKTMCGCGALIAAHLRYPGLLSLVGRETYPALMTSTWMELELFLKRLPPGIVKIKRPTPNSMGILEWFNGGSTLICSLRESDTWESANLGLAWVDEAHRQREDIVDKLCSRLRQPGMPRVALLTTNPAGRNWIYRWAHPKSRDRFSSWLWQQSNMFENPALPPDYIQRMERQYPPGTPAHKRWVLGMSTALEGAAFAEIFDSDPAACVHVIPGFPIPDAWERGRGLDWGIENPTVCLWAAFFEASVYVYRRHAGRHMSGKEHAKAIMEKERDDPPMMHTPADPSMWNTSRMEGGVKMSVADEFFEVGCDIYQANNERSVRLSTFFSLLTPDPQRVHPVTLKSPAPRLFIIDTEELHPLVDCLETVQWEQEPSSMNRDAKDDIKKREDHDYDALGYLLVDRPEMVSREPIRAKPLRARGVRGQYRGYR